MLDISRNLTRLPSACNLSLHWQEFIFFIPRFEGTGLAQWYSAGLLTEWLGAQIPAGAGNFSLHHHVQTGSGVHPPSYAVGIRGSFPGGKAAGAWSWPLTHIQHWSQECEVLYLHSPNTPSWRGAQLKHRDNFTFIFIPNLWRRLG
jgi:hypothetical protein